MWRHPAQRGKSSPIAQAWGQSKAGRLGSDNRSGGTRGNYPGRWRWEDPRQSLGKGWHEKKRQMKKRDLQREGRGGRKISWRMHLGDSRSRISDLLLSDPRQDTAPSLPCVGILTPPHRVEESMPAVLSGFIISSRSLFLSHRNLERHVKKGMAIRM